VGETLGIGEFARRAGLSVSAVRFYGDRGVVKPVFVDPATGYRFYDSIQLDSARLIGELRALGMSLAEVDGFLAGSPSAQRQQLDRHLAELEQRLTDTRALAHDVRARTLRQETTVTSMTIDSAAFGDALDQVLPAASTSVDHPVLACVLLEAKEGSLRMVATDSYRLAIRDLVPRSGTDAEFRALLPSQVLRTWREALPPTGVLQLDIGPDEASVAGDGVALREAPVKAEFPAYEALLARDEAAAEIVVDRSELLAVLESFAQQGDPVLLSTADDMLTVIRRDETASLPAHCVGPPRHVGIDPAFAASLVAVAVGPDLVVEIVDELRPLVLRSADDGTYTTMLMPVRLR
jgi:DNA-binding transcriptional MerR regulator